MRKMEKIRCKSCREPINLADQKNGRLKCPACGTVHKLRPEHIRPRWKALRPQFLMLVGGAALLLLVLVIIISVASCSGNREETTEATTTEATTEATASPAQQDAMNIASNYLAEAPFSYMGLVAQLEYDGIDYETAIYAVEHCGADWYEQAKAAAQSYFDLGGFDRDSLIETLVQFDAYTQAEAEEAADYVGLYAEPSPEDEATGEVPEV